MNHDLAELSTCYRLTWRWSSRHGPERLWHAITDPEEISAWMRYPADVELRVGGRLFVDFSRTDEGAIDAVIVEVSPLAAFAYAWGMSVVRWELAERDGGGSRVTFVHYGFSPEHVCGLGAGRYEFFDQFWAHVEGEPSPDGRTRPARHEELVGRYQAQMDRMASR